MDVEDFAFILDYF